MNSKTSATFRRLFRAVQADLSYNEEGKAEFHLAAKAALKVIGGELGLTKEQFQIRSNQAGVAVSGEVTLHANGIYIQLDQGVSFWGSSDRRFMFRACRGRRDYTGLANEWMTYKQLVDDLPAAIEIFRKTLGRGLAAQDARFAA